MQLPLAVPAWERLAQPAIAASAAMAQRSRPCLSGHSALRPVAAGHPAGHPCSCRVSVARRGAPPWTCPFLPQILGVTSAILSATSFPGGRRGCCPCHNRIAASWHHIWRKIPLQPCIGCRSGISMAHSSPSLLPPNPLPTGASSLSDVRAGAPAPLPPRGGPAAQSHSVHTSGWCALACALACAFDARRARTE